MRAFTKKESQIKIIDEEKSVTSGMNIINAKGLRNEAGDLNVSGVTWVNELGVSGEDLADSSSVNFTGVSGNVYYETLDGTLITGDGTSETLTNSSGSTVDVAVHDLTKMGALPPALASYFGKTNFEDLTASEVDEIAPDYVHSVETVGYSFSDGEYSPEILNKGRNLVSVDDFPASQAPYAEGTAADGPDNYWNNGTGKWYGNGVEGHHETGIYRCYSCQSVLIPVKKNTDYVLSFNIKKFMGYFGNQVSVRNRANSILVTTSSATLEGDIELSFNSGGNNYVFIYINFNNGHSFISDFLLEEGSIANTYIPPKKDSITLPEMNGLGGTYDDLNYKRVERETVTIATNSATASKSGTGSCVLISSTGDVVWGTISGTTISATTANGNYTVFYKLSTPVAQDPLPTKIPIYTGDNNIICEGAAISITHTKETATNEILAFAEGIRITDSKSFYEYQPVNATGKRRLENLRDYKISIDDIYLDNGWDERFENGKTFTLEITDDNDDETNVITTKYHGCVITSVARSEDQYIKRGVEITAESKEVIT
jgi:hypothetical protein